MQKSFSFAVRDSLINVGPLKDFSYGLRINADPNSTGLAKQSNYELVSDLIPISFFFFGHENSSCYVLHLPFWCIKLDYLQDFLLSRNGI